MALTNDQLALARSIYEKYWESYIQGNFEIFCSTLDEDFEMIGTSESEVAHSKSEGIEFYKAQMAEVVGKAEMRNRKISAKPLDDMVLINETCDIYVLAEPDLPADRQDGMFYSKIRISTLLHETNTGWKVIQQHGSLPDMRVSEGETIAFDKITKENLELRDAVKRRTVELENKNRELAIEAALEKVRAVAMGMKNPEDMLDVCHEISDQLQDFGVEKIRNVQTAIIDEHIGQYLCYQYFTPYDKTAVEKTEYLKSPVEHGMVKQMLASRDGYFIGGLSGQELEDFRSHRKEENHFPDPFLDKATGLDYCFLSIGEGGLGLTLYQPMAEDILTLFKRFHQVFSLAYQRFRDIQKAEAQAREAQIEVAVERVRAQSMAMHQPDDLDKVNKEILSQLKWLQIQGLSGVTFYLVDQDGWVKAYDFSSPGNIGDQKSYTLQFDFKKYEMMGYPFKIFEQTDLNYLVADYPLEKLKKAVFEIEEINPEVATVVKEALAKGILTHQWSACTRITDGMLAIDLVNPPSEDTKTIVLKIAGAFNQAYQRFLDLQKAETQAREAQIEVALERTRTQSMLMQHSDEIKSISNIFHEQLLLLNIPSEFSYVWLPDEANQSHQFWASWSEKNEGGTTLQSKQVTYPLDKTEPYTAACYAAWTNPDVILEEFIPPSDIAGFFEVWHELLAGATKLKAHFFPKGIYYSEAYMRYGCFGINIRRKLSEEEKNILKRFSIEFERAYTRFLDLKKAELQAREAQIEAALERVRARAMAMHHSDEIKDVARELRVQLATLGSGELETCAVNLYEVNEEFMESWSALRPPGSKAEILEFHFQLPKKGIAIIEDILKVYHSGVEEFSFISEGAKGVQWMQKMKELVPEMYSAATVTPEFEHTGTFKAWWTGDFFSGGALLMVTLDPPQQESRSLLKRFTKVFGQAYQRFQDLQKAEAHARESEIDLALERVRAQTMAMHSSEDVGKCVVKMFSELTSLGVDEGTRFGIGILNHDNENNQLWTARKNGDEVNMHIGNIDMASHPLLKSARKAWKKQVTLHHYVLEGEDLLNYYQMLNNAPDYKIQIPLEKLPEREIQHCFIFEHGFFYAFSPREFQPELIHITKRFSSLFEQTYRRYLDLQKAEAQAKEAQIEAALEKVRSRSLAMHKSGELNEVVMELFERLNDLQIPVTAVGISINIEDSKDLDNYTCGLVESGIAINNYRLPYFDHRIANDFFEAREKQLDFFVGNYSKQEKDSFYEYIINHTELKNELTEDIKQFIFQSPSYSISVVTTKNTMITLNDFEGKSLSDDQIDILKRFAKVFEQTYTRFLDLQKAEAQAKEAQIEAALERVRSRTMAMQSSSELGNVAAELFAQMNQLVTNLWTCGFVLCEKDRDEDEWWLSMDGDFTRGFFLPNVGDYAHATLYEGWQKGEGLRAVQLEGETLQQHYDWLMEIPVSRTIFEEMDAAGLARPDWQKLHAAYFSKGYLVLITREPCGEEEIFKRFAQVFDQTYTRFLDLQKAEAQAREAQVNLAVERVRARALAMFKSEEILQVVHKLKDEIMGLDIPNVAAATIHLKEPDGMCRVWDLTSLEIEDDGLHLPLDIRFCLEDTHPDFFMRRIWENEADYFVVTQKDSDFKHTLQWLRDNDQSKQADEAEEFFRSTQLKKVYHPTVPLNNGRMNLDLLDTPDPEIESILKKMAGAFDLAYKRFEDLQKAEAQAKEAKIQLALERVRARSLAMHRSEELADISLELVRQVQTLGMESWFCAFNIYDDDPRGSVEWGSNGQGTFPQYRTPREGVFLRYFEAGQRGETLLVNEIGEEACPAHYEYLCSLPGVGEQLLQMKAAGIPFPTSQIDHVAFFKYGYVLFITYEPAHESHDIFKRFANVFEQSYTRFLDLKKAEAQTREAKVEGALEKIRSRTMGMQSSDEMPEVANLLFLEVQALGIPAWSCGYNILAEDKTSSTCIMSSEGTLQRPFPLPLTGEASFIDWYHFLLGQEPFFTQELGGKAIEEHYNYMTSLPELKPIFKDIEAAGLSLPTYQINHLCKFTSGFLLFITYEKVPESHAVFKRFTNVFDQTYTRFLDLKKAEAQAREAQIENALEKVRSRSLAMQSPDELIEVVQLLREEMGALGVEELETSSIYIHDDESGETQCWFTIKNSDNPGKAVTDQMTLNLQDTWVGRKMLDFYRSPSNQTSILMQGGQRIEWIRYCEEKTELFGTSNFYGESIPDRTYHLYKFSNGYIGAAAPGEISTESWEVLKRATSVFSFAYTRFRDLQMAEASARVAVRQASLDRVRAEISSMRHADDLDRITPLFFHELTTLGIPFIRCGVFIIQEKQEIVEAYLSSPDGNSLGVLRLPYQASELTYQTVVAWRKGVIYRQHWNKEDFVQWINQLMEQDQIQDSSTYQGSAAPPESLDLHFVPFAQGMLYVGSENPLDEKELELVQALAKAFSIAYARYEDFVKLEQAKAEVESAMNELKATQSQLVQQEKLASLGQLTAGIAHEIKNPLNFVNNFSEVSIELVDEAIEERSKGPEARDESLVDEILIDIKSNLKKVHEHGSRANGIVTSMLQHSRGGSGKLDPTDLNALVKEYVNLSFHGMRAGKNPIDVEIDFELDPKIKEVPLIKEDFIRVIINLCNNAFDAMRGKMYQVQSTKYEVEVGKDIDYLPKLAVSTILENGRVRISLADNGPGIPDEIKDKILQPFFTTKKGTEGTGLGLSITHDIVKAHGGELKVETKEEVGSTFTIILPTTIS